LPGCSPARLIDRLLTCPALVVRPTLIRRKAMPEYEFDRSTPVTVALRMHRGIADIVAADTPVIRVEVTAQDGGDTSREAADSMKVALEGDTLLVQSPDHLGWSLRRTPKLSVTIKVPAFSNLQAKLASADLRAAGDYGIVQTDFASGDTYVERVAGDAELKTASGDIRIDRVGGGLRVTSASGDLRVGDVTGDVSLSSASGDVTAGTIGGSLKSRTASGDIEIGRVRTGTTNISSASGDVKVGVAAGTGVWLDINSASGSTRSDLTMTDAAPSADQQATLELKIRTASGDITINRVHASTESESH
jgi:hypothetical protein